MSIATAPSATRAPARLSPISWPTIFASLAVGISVMLLLTLAGVAVGVSAVEPGDNPQAITVGAAAWQMASMLVAAVVGGYVAARLSGLRRTADGVLHGAVSWGAATVMYAALATTALGALTAGMFGLLAAPPELPSAALTIPDRGEAQRTLQNIGMSADQARIVIEELAGTAAVEPPQAESADGIGTATAWLSATVLLSLALSLVGGAFGARGVRRGNRHAGFDDDSAAGSESRTPY